MEMATCGFLKELTELVGEFDLRLREREARDGHELLQEGDVDGAVGIDASFDLRIGLIDHQDADEVTRAQTVAVLTVGRIGLHRRRRDDVIGGRRGRLHGVGRDGGRRDERGGDGLGGAGPDREHVLRLEGRWKRNRRRQKPRRP